MRTRVLHYYPSFLSTPSARRATVSFYRLRRPEDISIHALREEGDRKDGSSQRRRHYFYPRPPRGGRRNFLNESLNPVKFLSTPSARRATARVHFVSHPFEFLSTPSARRATSDGSSNKSPPKISIHALREEGDGQSTGEDVQRPYFYPRPPRGGRPELRQTQSEASVDFYPRPPRGGRHSFSVCQ